MKKLLLVLFLLSISFISSAQQASDYFPSQTGFQWNFKATPLDSLNNPIDSQAVFRIDSFATVTNYEGKLANIVPTKTGPLQTISLQPFTDSLFYHTEGTDGFEYLNINSIKGFLQQLDSMQIDPNFNFLNFFTSLQDWYSVYRFSSGVNSEYTLLQVDTSLTINSTNYPIRFKYLGTRLSDETIQTVQGSYNCKKFLIQWKVFAFSILNLLTTNDTIWIAPDNWIVQDIIPSNTVDLSLLGIDPFTIPGLETKLTDEITFVENNTRLPEKFVLEQNYPNPFNPTTKIKYQIPDVISTGGRNLLVSIKVYDILGNEVATLVNEEKPAGNYEVVFNAENLPSGVYFYQLSSGSFVQTKKFVLLK